MFLRSLAVLSYQQRDMMWHNLDVQLNSQPLLTAVSNVKAL